MILKTTLCVTTSAVALLLSSAAFSADLAAPPASTPAADPGPCKAALANPAFGPTIKANPDPVCFTSAIGDLYVGGAVSGYAYHTAPPFDPASPVGGLPLNTGRDAQNRIDFSNLMATLQKADGPLQFYVQAGLYSFPTLGLPVYSSLDQNTLYFGPVPIVYGKYIFNDAWSLQVGRMPTNIGTEFLFTYQNINITRGLLVGQENFFNQGVQVNYASGPWSASVAVVDGFFSGELNWVTGAVTYKIDDNNLVSINGGTHFATFNSLDRGSKFQYATPLTLQNSSILVANYTYTKGPWTATPYFQYTRVDRDQRLGLAGAETYGGALLVAYNVTVNFSLGGRIEYIAQSGNRFNPDAATSLLFGAGSSAVSYTITPTFNFDRFFIRGEYSHVDLYGIQLGNLADGTLGTGFGRTGNVKSQDRYMVETGFTF